MDPTTRFRAVATAAVDEFLVANPEVATYLGEHRYDDHLTPRSAHALSVATDVARVRLAELEAIDANALDAQDAVDHGMLATALRQRIFAHDELAEHTWNPLAYNVGEALYPLLARTERPAEARLLALAGRLGETPDILALAREQLADVPRVHVETALGQNAGAVHLVEVEVPALLADEPSLRPVVEPVRLAAAAALGAHAEFLRGLLETATPEHRLGAECFARKLALTLDADISADEVVERAWQMLREVQGQLYELAMASYDAGVSSDGGERRAAITSMLDAIAQERPDDATIVDTARSALADATRFVTEHDLVTVLEQETQIQEMPEFRRGVAVAYCDAPGPLEDGGVTFFAIAPTPRDWPTERKDSFYREYNDALVVDLSVHEAMPGHMLQLAHARRFAGSTRVRKVFRSGSFIEGWAVHAERLMAERGFGGPAVRAQQLKMELRGCINAIIDHGVHAAGMTEAEAMELMTVEGYQEQSEAAGKWRRACLTSTQLSTYFVGYIELADLLARAPAGWSDRQVHDTLLAHGNPSPRRLAQLLAW